jgi:hypothetical protein
MLPGIPGRGATEQHNRGSHPGRDPLADRRGPGERPEAERCSGREQQKRRWDEQTAAAVGSRPESLLRDRRGEDGHESAERRPLPSLHGAVQRERTDREGEGQRRRRVTEIETKADGVSERPRRGAGCDEVPGK